MGRAGTTRIWAGLTARRPLRAHYDRACLAQHGDQANTNFEPAEYAAADVAGAKSGAAAAGAALVAGRCGHVRLAR